MSSWARGLYEQCKISVHYGSVLPTVVGVWGPSCLQNINKPLPCSFRLIPHLSHHLHSTRRDLGWSSRPRSVDGHSVFLTLSNNVANSGHLLTKPFAELYTYEELRSGLLVIDWLCTAVCNIGISQSVGARFLGESLELKYLFHSIKCTTCYNFSILCFVCYFDWYSVYCHKWQTTVQIWVH